MEAEQALQKINLPLSVMTVIDLSRVGRELEQLDEFLIQSAIRTPGTPMQLPRLSKMLDDVASVNHVNLLEEPHRKALLKALSYLKEHAPKLHISFAAEPNGAFVNKVAEYIRANISSVALLQVGLQPTIAAGCIIRSPNRQFDLSLRQRLKDKRSELGQIIHAIKDAPQGAPAAAQAQGVPK
jgi:F0F1-type ATP synthase delta subunit